MYKTDGKEIKVSVISNKKMERKIGTRQKNECSVLI